MSGIRKEKHSWRAMCVRIRRCLSSFDSAIEFECDPPVVLHEIRVFAEWSVGCVRKINEAGAWESPRKENYH